MSALTFPAQIYLQPMLIPSTLEPTERHLMDDETNFLYPATQTFVDVGYFVPRTFTSANLATLPRLWWLKLEHDLKPLDLIPLRCHAKSEVSMTVKVLARGIGRE